MAKKESWEVDSIDLDFRHYCGSQLDVIKKIKSDIELYLLSQNATEKQCEIYSAIYNALDYYIAISNIETGEFSTENSFLSDAIQTFNNDLVFLSRVFSTENDTDAPIISIDARVKSPISFMNKVKEKMSEYINEGRNLRVFNESLRDIIGARIVVNPPEEIENQGLDAESNFLYQVCYALMVHHGIYETNQKDLLPGNFRFLNVNTRYHPNKMQELKDRLDKEGLDKTIVSGKTPIFIPKNRIPEIENPSIDSKIKDYNKYPKYSGYQSLHVCIVPEFSDNKEIPSIPSCIIPADSHDYVIEYQFRTQKQHDFAEHSTASHKNVYKPGECSYHRFAVPLYIDVDRMHDIRTNYSPKSSIRSSIKRIKLRNFAESFERLYGYTFQDRFGISFKAFRDFFSTEERNQILALRRNVVHDEVTDMYSSVPSKHLLALKQSDILELQNFINSDHTLNEIRDYFDKLGLLDGTIDVDDSNTRIRTPRSNSFQLFPIISSINKELSNLESPTNNSSNDEKSIDDN